MAPVVLQIAIVHKNPEVRNRLHAAVAQLGHIIAFHASTGAELVAKGRTNRPDLVIVQEFLADAKGTEAVEQMAGEQGLPAIVIVDRHNGQLLSHTGSQNVVGILQEPVRSSDLIPIIPIAMRQFREREALRERIKELKAALNLSPAPEDPGP